MHRDRRSCYCLSLRLGPVAVANGKMNVCVSCVPTESYIEITRATETAPVNPLIGRIDWSLPSLLFDSSPSSLHPSHQPPSLRPVTPCPLLFLLPALSAPQLNKTFQEEESPVVIYCISMQWFREWEGFVKGVDTGNLNNVTPLD